MLDLISLVTYRHANTCPSSGHKPPDDHQPGVSAHWTQRVPNHVPGITNYPDWLPPPYLTGTGYQERRKGHTEEVYRHGYLGCGSADSKI
jgi:hypothetical protein